MRPSPRLSPETAICLEACRVAPASCAVALAPPDARKLVRTAAYHRVTAFVSERAELLGVPEAALGPLRAGALATLHRNMQILAEARRAFAALNAAGVPAIRLKGIHLLDCVYGHPGQRPMSDVDVLVPPEAARSAIASLRAIGYRADERETRHGIRHDGECRLDLEGTHTMLLELHTSLNRPTRHHWFPQDWIWNRSVECPLDGTPARALCWADALVYLCAHAVPHMFAQMIWLRDIAGVAERVNVEGMWEDVAACAREARAETATHAGLAMAVELLGAEVPEEAFHGLSSGRKVPRRCSAESLYGNSCYSTVRSVLWRLGMADSWRDAAAILGSCARRKVAGVASGIAKRRASASGAGA